MKYRILSNEQLKRISEHRYSCEGSSLLDPFMQPFWCWAVKQIPLTWAPNALTLAGLLFNGLSTLILMVYCPNANCEAPRWVYLLCAFGLFAYQTLDAIDGKQARRTNSSSPLGELFDHGCDALSIIFVVVGTCVAGKVGAFPWIFLLECFATMTVFYLAQWQTYCSGTLKFGLCDVTESQVGVMLVYLLTGIFGPSMWDAEVFSTGLPAKLIPAGVSLVIGSLVYVNFLTIIYQVGFVKQDGKIKGMKTLVPLIPISFLLFIGTFCSINSSSQLLKHHPVLYGTTLGIAATKLSCKILTIHMSGCEMEVLDSTFVGPIVLFLTQCFSTNYEYLALWVCCIYCIIDLLRYFVHVCSDIADFLNIRTFQITPRKQNKETDNHSHSS